MGLIVFFNFLFTLLSASNYSSPVPTATPDDGSGRVITTFAKVSSLDDYNVRVFHISNYRPAAATAAASSAFPRRNGVYSIIYISYGGRNILWL